LLAQFTPKICAAAASFPDCGVYRGDERTHLNPYPIDTNLPVAVIGAGPVGLAALAHLVERGIDSVLLEASSRVAGNFREFGHVRLFPPWRHTVDKAARRALEQSGWTSPNPDTLPTATELVSQYLEPLAALSQIAGRVRLGSKVVLMPAEDSTR